MAGLSKPIIYQTLLPNLLPENQFYIISFKFSRSAELPAGRTGVLTSIEERP